MYEIIMLFAFLCAATSQLFPGTPRGDNPDLLKKKRLEGKACKRTKASVPKQKTCHNKPVRRSNRKPALHVRLTGFGRVGREPMESSETVLINCLKLLTQERCASAVVGASERYRHRC
jgi:hypothetical protein